MTDHTVEPGDCIWSISMDSGHFWKTIWNDSGNIQLRQDRKDPNVLAAGDVVHVPDIVLKSEDGATEMRHRFKRKGVPVSFKIQMLRDGKPRKSEDYRLDIDGVLRSGKTDGDGWIKASIPPDAQQGKLFMGNDVYELKLGHLEPADDLKGAQQRLQNLGLYGGEIDGQKGPLTQGALALFQNRQGLKCTGELDDATKDALKKAHHA